MNTKNVELELVETYINKKLSTRVYYIKVDGQGNAAYDQSIKLTEEQFRELVNQIEDINF